MASGSGVALATQQSMPGAGSSARTPSLHRIMSEMRSQPQQAPPRTSVVLQDVAPGTNLAPQPPPALQRPVAFDEPPLVTRLLRPTPWVPASGGTLFAPVSLPPKAPPRGLGQGPKAPPPVLGQASVPGGAQITPFDPRHVAC